VRGSTLKSRQGQQKKNATSKKVKKNEKKYEKICMAKIEKLNEKKELFFCDVLLR
jgi:hypothetical protein